MLDFKQKKAPIIAKKNRLYTPGVVSSGGAPAPATTSMLKFFSLHTSSVKLNIMGYGDGEFMA